MKEPYVEGLASYGGPESCVHIREGVGEALIGERAGRVSSRVIHAPRLRAREGRGAEAGGACRWGPWVGGGGEGGRGEEGGRVGVGVIAPGHLGSGEVRGAEAVETCR